LAKAIQPLLIVAAIAVNVIPGIGQVLSAAMITAITSAGIAAGLGMASSMLGLGPKPPKVSTANRDRLFASIDPGTPRKIWLGNTAGAVDVRYEEWTDIAGLGENGKQGILHRVFCHSGHAATAIDELWLEDEMAWSASGGIVSKFAQYLGVTTRLAGTPGNTVAIGDGSKWGSSRRLTGCAYSVVDFRVASIDPKKKPQDSPFSGGIPTRITFRGRGAPVYDPRMDSTVGGTGPQRAADQTTWTWGGATGDAARNPVLQVLWYLLGWRIQNPATGVWKLSVGRGIPASRLDIASFITAANICDETVTSSVVGSEPRYRSDAAFSEGDDPNLVLDALKAACNAEIRDYGGRISIHIRRNDLANVTVQLSADDLLGGFSWKQTAEVEQSLNEVRGKYIDPSNTSLYQLIDYPSARVEPIDGIERVEEYNLPTVQSVSQAQRIAKMRLQRSFYRGQFAGDFNARAWRASVGKVVELTFPPLGWANKKFRVLEMGIRVDGVCPMVLQEENADIYAWDNSDKPALSPPVPTVYDPALAPIRQQLATVETGATRNVWQGTWAAGVAYLAGDLVQFGTVIFRVLTDHTSVAGQTPPTTPLNYGPWFDLGSASQGVSAQLQPPTVVIPADEFGNVTSYANASTTFVIEDNGTSIVSSFTYSVAANPSGLAVNLVGPVATVTGGFGNAIQSTTLTLRATGTGAYGGMSFDRKLTLTKALQSLDTTPPGVPPAPTLSSTLVIQSDGTTVTFLRATWTPPADSDLAGHVFALREGTSGNFVEYQIGAAGEFMLPVRSATIYQAKVRAFDKRANFSAFSTVTTYTTGTDAIGPAVPSLFTVSAGFKVIYLQWRAPTLNADGTTLNDLAAVEVYERLDSTTPAVGGADRIAVLPQSEGGQGFFVREGVTSGPRFYWIAAVDTSGNRSALVGPQSATPALQIIQAEVAASAIDTLQLADNAVNGLKLAAGSVVANHLTAGSVVASKLLLTDLSSLVLDMHLAEVSAASTGYWQGSGITTTPISASTGIASRNAAVFPASGSAQSLASDPMPVEGDQTYFVQGVMWVPSGTATGRINVNFYADADATSLISATTVGVVTNAPFASAESNRRYGNVTVPTGARSIRYIFVRDPGGTGQLFVSEPIVRRAANARLIVDGSILTQHMTAGTINGDRIMAASMVASQFFVSGNAAKDGLPTGLTIGVGGTTIGSVDARAADPLNRANSLSTTLLPGLVLINGSTRLSNWLYGPDLTKIDGGNLGANSVRANVMTVGNRGLDITGVEFEYNPTTGQLTWTAGSVLFENDSAAQVSNTIPAGGVTHPGGGVGLYFYWTRSNTNGATTPLQTSTDWASVRAGLNSVIFCGWFGALNFIANYGGTILNGAKITTDSMDANRIKAGSVIANNLIVGAGGPSLLTLGTTATWASVTGFGRPADNATVGATWNGNITGQPADNAVLNSLQQWAEVQNRPANELVPFGSFTTMVSSNATKKAGGSDTYQGGARGDAMLGACYISATVSPSRRVTLVLDDSGTNTAADQGRFFGLYEENGAGGGTLQLYENRHLGAGFVQLANVAIPSGTTSATSRLVLLYDEQRIAVGLDGFLYAGAAAPGGLRLWPCVHDYNNNSTTAGIDYGAADAGAGEAGAIYNLSSVLQSTTTAVRTRANDGAWHSFYGRKRVKGGFRFSCRVEHVNNGTLQMIGVQRGSYPTGDGQTPPAFGFYFAAGNLQYMVVEGIGQPPITRTWRADATYVIVGDNNSMRAYEVLDSGGTTALYTTTGPIERDADWFVQGTILGGIVGFSEIRLEPNTDSYLGNIAGTTLVAMQALGNNIFGQMSAANISAFIGGAAIGTALIGTAAITQALIANLAVGSAQMADLAVLRGKIADLAVDSAKIADLAVTRAKIASLAVGTAQIDDLAVSSAKIANLSVDTLKIAGNAITVPQVTEGFDAFVGAGFETTVVEMADFLTVGDASDGGALVNVYGWMDGGSQKDVGMTLNLWVDTGGGYQLVKSVGCGARTSDGNTFSKIPLVAAYAATSISVIRVRVGAQALQMPGAGSAFSSTFRAPTIVVMGAKR
jgi:hypothetical protein